MKCVFFLLSLTTWFILPHTTSADMADYAIINARVIDGTASDSYRANVLITDGRISAIDRTLKTVDAHQIIDATGRYLTPGFIDLHSHGSPVVQGDFKNFIAMGVTTVSLGQDGSSPMTKDLASWIEKANAQGMYANVAMFIGHNTLRRLVATGPVANISDDQLAQMKRILVDNMDSVFGLSTGLEYSPGLHAREDELIALAKLVGEQNKLIMSHMRNEDDDAVIGSINELMRQGKYARVHASHLKSVYGKGVKRAEEILDVLYQARNDGIEITADVYPYSASYTGIAIVFPNWAKTKEQFALAKKTRRDELAEFIRNKVNSRNGPQATLIGTEPYVGKTLAEVAEQLKKSFVDVLIDDIGPSGASAAYFVMDKDLQDRLIADPLIALSSDGGISSFHPRGHGTFAKLIEEYVVNRGIFTLEQAVRKVTSYPAEILQLQQRGLIKVGYHADLTIFAADNVKATATYSNPHQLAVGFDYVFVNGQIAKYPDRFSEALHGQVLQP